MKIDIDTLLSNITRKQRKIYDMHMELFDEIFSHEKLLHVEPEILEILLNEQKIYLITQLQDCNSHEYKRMTVKGCQEDVDRAIEHNLDELVEVVLGNIKDLENPRA